MPADSPEQPSARTQLPLAGQPDPSFAATEALNREVAYLRQLLEAQVESAKDMAKTLRISDEKFEGERDRRITEVAAESDRRLTEVAVARAEALKIKEEADREALRLDREIRQFKDEKAGAVTEAAVATLDQRVVPIERYVAAQQGSSSGAAHSQQRRDITFGQVLAVLTLILTAALMIASIAAISHGFR